MCKYRTFNDSILMYKKINEMKKAQMSINQLWHNRSYAFCDMSICMYSVVLFMCLHNTLCQYNLESFSNNSQHRGSLQTQTLNRGNISKPPHANTCIIIEPGKIIKGVYWHLLKLHQIKP